MKFKKQEGDGAVGVDMTPMIDMTFQLIIFFMLALNFGEGEQDERIKLPTSELAKPPEAATEEFLVLQLARNNSVIYAGQFLQVDQMGGYLAEERKVLEDKGKSAADATVYIRGDADAQSGFVQLLIQKCQENGFEKFGLRAQYEPR